MSVKTVAESILHVLQGLVSGASLQPQDRADMQEHIDAALGAIKSGVDTVVTTGEAVAGAAAPVVGQAIEDTANTVIAAEAGVFAPELIALADGFLEAAGNRLEDAIAALFHVKGWTLPAAPVSVQTVTSDPSKASA